MEKGLGLLSTEPRVVTKAEPRLRLLLELEPRHEAFLSNLADAFFRSTPEPLKTTSPPGTFWDDVFVPTELPWKSFQESMLWHIVVLLAAWSLTQAWASRPKPRVNQAVYRTSESIYYSASKAYVPPRRNTPHSQSHAKARTSAAATRAKAVPVATENRGTPKLVVPPDLKLAEGPRAPNLTVDPSMPSVPLSATARTSPPFNGLTSAVAPPPDVTGRTKGLAGSLQAGIVAPPVDARGIGSDHTLRGPGSPNVVAPPPSLLGTSRGPGSLGTGNAQVVAPPPSLAGQGLRGAGAQGLSAGGVVVPPPPSLEHSGKAGAVSGPGVAVVPPPPSMQGTGVGGGNGRGVSANGVGTAVVPPPPTVQSGSGGGLFATLSSWFSSSSPKIVPPPPGLQGEGGGAGSGAARVGSLAGGGSEVVPPPPSMQGGGNGRGRVTSLASGGNEVVPPPPSVQGAGGGSGARKGFGNGLSGTGAAVVPPPPSLSGSGSGGGTGVRGGGALSGGNVEIVPPPPSLAGGGGGTGNAASGAGNRLGSLGGGGGAVVPPPPSVAGTGAPNGAGNRLGSLGGGSGNVVGAPASAGGTGGTGGNGGAGGGARDGSGGVGGGMNGGAPAGTGSGSTGPLEQMDPLPDVPDTAQNAPSIGESAAGPAEDVPLRLIAVPGASTNGSFFSKYEVVLAERTVKQGQKELIKLVYESLPYQKRLSEYDWSTTKIYKLRAVADPRCDESLLQMMWPEGGDAPDAEMQADANRLAAEVGDKNTKLHCFRTTADDFQRAMSHGH